VFDGFYRYGVEVWYICAYLAKMNKFDIIKSKGESRWKNLKQLNRGKQGG